MPQDFPGNVLQTFFTLVQLFPAVHPNTQDSNHMFEEAGLEKQGTRGGAPVQKRLYV